MQNFYTGFFLQSEDGNMQFAQPSQALRVAPLLHTSSLDQLAVDEEYFAFAEKGES
jgi:hypothetical protein